jgi:hypothetical protein
MRSVGFVDVRMEGHSFATAEFDPDTYGGAIVPMIKSFVPGHNGVSDDETKACASEQRDLGERGEFYFACLQLCFAGIRPS